MERDLCAYFEQRLKQKTDEVRVEYQLLRDSPTQTGISYPKYNLWARIFSGRKLVASGAVRVAAVEKLRFDVTDFLSSEEILAAPARVQLVFPAVLKEKILGLAKVN